MNGERPIREAIDDSQDPDVRRGLEVFQRVFGDDLTVEEHDNVVSLHGPETPDEDFVPPQAS